MKVDFPTPGVPEMPDPDRPARLLGERGQQRPCGRR